MTDLENSYIERGESAEGLEAEGTLPTPSSLDAALYRVCQDDPTYHIEGHDSGVRIMRNSTRVCVFNATLIPGASSRLLVSRSSEEQTFSFLTALRNALGDRASEELDGLQVEKDLGSHIIDLVHRRSVEAGTTCQIILNGEFGANAGDSSYLFFEYHPNAVDEIWVNVYLKQDHMVESSRTIELEINLIHGESMLLERVGEMLKSGLQESMSRTQISLRYSNSMIRK